MDLVGLMNPALQELRLAQTQARASMKQAQADWDKRREALDMLLPTALVGAPLSHPPTQPHT